jgi:hypothetical protein
MMTSGLGLSCAGGWETPPCTDAPRICRVRLRLTGNGRKTNDRNYLFVTRIAGSGKQENSSAGAFSAVDLPLGQGFEKL